MYDIGWLIPEKSVPVLILVSISRFKTGTQLNSFCTRPQMDIELPIGWIVVSKTAPLLGVQARRQGLSSMIPFSNYVKLCWSGFMDMIWLAFDLLDAGELI